MCVRWWFVCGAFFRVELVLFFMFGELVVWNMWEGVIWVDGVEELLC